MVFFGEDFITVKKEKILIGKDLKHGIISEINDYYSKGNKIVIRKKEIKLKTKFYWSSNESNEVINKINEVLDSKLDQLLLEMEEILHLNHLKMELLLLNLKEVVQVALVQL